VAREEVLLRRRERMLTLLDTFGPPRVISWSFFAWLVPKFVVEFIRVYEHMVK